MTPGTLIDGRFLVERQAGAGGMGTVYRAVDRRDGAPVALKVLRGTDAVDVERLVREAAILAELDHPGIVRYVGHGVTAAGEHYLAMEWLDGEDLATRLRRRPLTDAEALSVVKQAAAAVGFAHARGAVHRDLKPSNLFLRGGDVGEVAVLDFGIAALAGDPQRLTQSGVLLGTPGYVAPEHAQGKPTQDPRSDVFSLGCVLFECLAGRPAFEGLNPMAVLAKLLLQEPPRLGDARPGVAPPLDALVARMLAKAPALRPQSLGEVIAELDAISASSTLGAGPATASPAAALPTLVSAGVALAPQAPQRSDGPALTREEHHLVSVVLAGRPADGAAPPPALDPGLADAVGPHGGQVTSLAGGLLAVTPWAQGTPIDRAERAARCALALRERSPELAVAVVTGRGQIAARVVEGDAIDRGVLALGRTRAGAVSVDEATAAMLGVREGGDRGDDVAELLRAARFAREGSLPPPDDPACVGRNRELAMLEGIFAGCVSERVATAALVTGPARSGKSHLRRALVERLRQRDAVEILKGSAGALAPEAALGAFSDLVRNAAGIRPGEPIEAQRARLTARLGRRLQGPALARVASLLGELAGAPPSDGHGASAARGGAPPGEALRAAWEEWLAAECGAGPVLVVLEDLHWADAASLALVESTLKSLRELPLMILALARPEARADVSSAWARRDLPVIKLGPLSARASEQLVRDLLGEGAAGAVVDRLVERSSGHPFFLVELVRAAAAGRPDAPPFAVLALIEARLDAEGADARRVLRAASVFGDRFTAAGVAMLLGSGAGEIQRALEELSARELVTRGPEGEYAFCHALVREAAHAMLTEPDRALGHRLARTFLEGAYAPGEARAPAREGR